MTLRNFNEAYKNDLVSVKEGLTLKARILNSKCEGVDFDLRGIDERLYDRKILNITQEGDNLIFHIEGGLLHND